MNVMLRPPASVAGVVWLSRRAVQLAWDAADAEVPIPDSIQRVADCAGGDGSQHQCRALPENGPGEEGSD